jgi:tetratricopeptide (TPR) repeat protein
MGREQMRMVAGRYAIEGSLGDGGMGSVYRALDNLSGARVALKRLVVPQERKREHFVALFEREYHTLAQLAHPSVIVVYDYGVDEAGPFYTMELLTGRDLHDSRELPFREICGAFYDVASSLSLLHARRLVHRDVTARNIRIVAPGRAKLLDFGALAPMGACGDIVCTPMYLAPEALLMQSIDGRADLYALGVALYRALTGNFPYRGKTANGMRSAWRKAPVPPHELLPALPRALSQLTMSLIALDRDARPRDAGQVMERLAAIGELERDEPAAIRGAYLFAPTLVGRSDALRCARELLVGAMRGRGGALLFTGPSGVGRTRMLDAAVLEAKVMGATVLRASGHDGFGELALVQSLIEQLGALVPQVVARALAKSVSPHEGVKLFSPSGDDHRLGVAVDLQGIVQNRAAMIAALRELLDAVAIESPLVIAADDLHASDATSLAVLSGLVAGPHGRHVLLLGSMLASGKAESPAGNRAAAVLAERCERYALAPLDRAGIRALVQSVFGAGPHLDMLSDRLHAFSRGRPRDALALAEHLVSTGVIGYRNGAFSLPETLAGGELPQSLSAALATRARGLSGRALALAQAHALSGRRALTLEECRRLAPTADEAALRAALDELIAADVFRSDGPLYLLRHDGWIAALRDGMDDAQRAQRHLELAGMLARDGADSLALAYHCMHGGDRQRAVAIVTTFANEWHGDAIELFGKTSLRPHELGTLLTGMCELIAQHHPGRDKRLLAVLRYFLMAVGVYHDPHWFMASAGEVEGYLTNDAGHTIYQSLDPAMAPMPRLLEALRLAQEAYVADAQAHHYPPAEAIRHLVLYAVSSIAVASQTCDERLRRRLPELLRPFAPLSPAIDCLTRNCDATAKVVEWSFEEGIEGFKSVFETISALEGTPFEGADEIRAAVAYGLGALYATLGAADEARRWLDLVSSHPRQASGALRVRGLLALQLGDFAAAEAYREAAEQYDLESEQKQLFGQSLRTGEVTLLGVIGDLSLLTQTLHVIEPLAERFEGWQSYARYASARCDYLRGNLEESLAAFDACTDMLRRARPGACPDGPWYVAEVGALDALTELGRFDEARARAERALTVGDGRARGIRFDGIKRALALCEAKLGDPQGARKRLDGLIANRLELGTRGVWLGILYEARTLVELWDGQLEAAVEAFEQARGEYVRCPASGLTARLEALRRHLLDAGVSPPSSGDVGAREPDAIGRSTSAPATLISQALDRCRDAAARAQRGLALLCSQADAIDGHLYLLQGSELELVASLGDRPAPPGLKALAQARVTPEEDEQPTVAMALTSVALPATPGFRVEGRSASDTCEYSALCIRADLGGESALIGVAALGFVGPIELRPEVLALANAFGDYLLRAGTSVSLTAKSGMCTREL